MSFKTVTRIIQEVLSEWRDLNILGATGKYCNIMKNMQLDVQSRKRFVT